MKIKKIHEMNQINKIPTIKELFKKYSTLYQFEEGSPEYLIDEEDFQEAAIEFAKIHVELALKSAHRNMQLPMEDLDFTLDSYPISNIK